MQQDSHAYKELDSSPANLWDSFVSSTLGPPSMAPSIQLHHLITPYRRPPSAPSTSNRPVESMIHCVTTLPIPESTRTAQDRK